MRDVAFYLIADLSICLLGGMVTFGIIYLSRRLHWHREGSVGVVLLLGLLIAAVGSGLDVPSLRFVGGLLMSPLVLLPHAILLGVLWACCRGVTSLFKRPHTE